MINKDEILKLAKLSKLRFNNEEVEDISHKINDILNYMQEIEEVDVTNVEPLYSVLEPKDITREDEVLNTVKKQDFLDNAPDKDDNFVIVAKIV